MKRYISTFLSLLFVFSLMAQTSSPQAKAVIDRAAAKLQKGAWQLNFKISNTSLQNDALASQKGVLKLQGDKLYLSAGDVVSFFDGKTQWVYMKKLNEVSISEPSKAELQEISPVLILTSYAKTHRVGFDEVAEKDGFYHVSLYPLDNKTDYFRVQFTISKTTNMLKDVRISQRSGERLSITFDTYQEIAAPTSDMFSFVKSKYPGVSINDLR